MKSKEKRHQNFAEMEQSSSFLYRNAYCSMLSATAAHDQFYVSKSNTFAKLEIKIFKSSVFNYLFLEDSNPIKNKPCQRKTGLFPHEDPTQVWNK